MKLVSLVFNLLTFFYPIILILGYKFFGIGPTAIALIIIFVLRLFLLKDKSDKKSYVLPLAGILLASFALYMNEAQALLYYPVFVSVFFFSFFAGSFLREETVVEQIAAKTDKDFKDEARPYCRKVTFVWSVFFVLNGSFAYWTTLDGEMNDKWLYYNGFLSYCLIGILMGLEYAFRVLVVKRRHAAK